MYSSRIRHLISAVILGASVLVPARGAAAQTTPPPAGAEDRAGGLKNHIQVVLRADRAPAPGDLANLTFAAAPMLAVPDLRTEWILPAGAELVGGPLVETHGALVPGQAVSLTRQIRFLSPGVYKIAAQASFQLNSASRFAATGVLFYTIKADGTSSVSTKDPAAINPQHSKIDTEIITGPTLPASAAGPAKTQDDPCFSITGRAMRIDRPITSAGRGAAVMVPLRFAKVEMRESDTLFDDSYGDTTTDANGNYSFSFCDDDGVFDDTLELYVRLRAEIHTDGRDIVEVEDTSWIDEVYEFDTPQQSSGGGSLTFNMTLNEMQSSVFNIADAILQAQQFWDASGGANGGDRTFGEESEVHWEPGYGETGSYYTSSWEEITLADDPSDSDEWDDSVIMHEWAHSSDDEYSCDDNPGGQHFVNQLVSDPELSWGEGYPDYYQSAVRAARGDAQGNFYFDIDGSGTAGIILDLETWDTTQPTLVSVLNEFSIAAALWDLNDTANDAGDRVSVGHPTLQNVFTSSSFESNGFFDDTCTFNTYMQSWKDTGKPTDGATAAAVTQNTGLANPFGTLLAATAQDANVSDGLIADKQFSPASVQAPEGDVHYFDNYKWWQQLTLIADNSASMAASNKFGSVKTVLGEQVNDLSTEPKGVEFALHTFNNSSSKIQTPLKGRFYADQIAPVINNLNTVGTADPNCQVASLSAMLQTLPGRHGGEAWLFTDGDSSQTDVTSIRQALQNHQVHGSFALLGGCSSAPGTTSTTLNGAQKAFLGKAANKSQPGGIVPYLLTAIASGGQFLYVGPNQMSDAADIMRAQLTHSSGAGRWSDYVSDSQTYLQDRLSSWEYQWQELSGNAVPGTTFGSIVNLNQPFTFWNVPRTTAEMAPTGLVMMGGSIIPNPRIDNTPLPNPATPNNSIYPLWDLTPWDYLICAAQANAPDAPASPQAPACGGEQWHPSFLQVGSMVTMEMTGTVYVNPNSYRLGYQVILNSDTGEIRFQYRSNQPNFASSATIGLENNTGTLGVQVSYNDTNGATDGMGYKFTPAPPQPTKTYTVPVDSMMSSVGFLLTGYSGDFDPLDVRMPDGSPISCADTAHVLCLNLGLVQYVQADVLNHTGVWSATVGAGPSGNGTFAFSSMAASPISVDSPGDHSRSTSNSSPLLINLGQAISGGNLQAWLQQPNGDALCPLFTLFDDGVHGDGRAGDGRFGSAAFSPCKAGTGYLHVRGEHNGTSFERIDTIPFTFQPIQVSSLGDGVVLGDDTNLRFRLENNDSVRHCYRSNWQVPDGWLSSMNLSLGEILVGTCLNPGSFTVKTLIVTPTVGLPSGTTDQVHVGFVEREQGIMSDSASASVTRYHYAASIEIVNEFFHNYIRPNNVDTATLHVAVMDDVGVNVADGTLVQLETSLGSVDPGTGTTINGQIPVTFTAGTIEGDAIITATEVSTGLQATTTLHIHAPVADRVDLVVTPPALPLGTTSAALIATVYDRWNNPIPNQTVRIGVEGDGQVGTVNGAEVITGTTNAQGQIVGSFSKDAAILPVGVRAELLEAVGGSTFKVIHEDREVILIGARIFLPVLQR